MSAKGKEKKVVVSYLCPHLQHPAAQATHTSFFFPQISNHCTDSLLAKQVERDVDLMFLFVLEDG